MIACFQNAKFPAVTICNMNMLRFDKLPDSYFDDIIASISSQGMHKGTYYFSKA